MPQPNSDHLQHQLAELLAKSRRLREHSAELDEEIRRLTRAVAGVPGSEDSEGAEENPPGRLAPRCDDGDQTRV